VPRDETIGDQAEGGQSRQCSFLVHFHQAAIACDVSSKNGDEFSLQGRRFHLVSYSPNGDSALTLQKARHGLRDKRLAQRKVANECNSGMPQRDILPIPAVTGREAGSSSSDPCLYDPHGRHYRCENESDLTDLTSPGRKHADRRSPHNGGREPSKNGEPLC
jgi:hypothetical protein